MYLNQKVTGEAATVVIDGVGDVSKNTSIVNASGYVALADMPGSIGRVVDINTTAAFTSATISIPYNESGLRGASENDLKMYYISEADHSIKFLDVQGIDTVNNVVWGKTNHFSTYGIVSYSSYMSTWNSGSNPTVPEYTYGDKINIKAQVHNTGDGLTMGKRWDKSQYPPDFRKSSARFFRMLSLLSSTTSVNLMTFWAFRSSSGQPLHS